jgi:peptidoglycan/LPS O-acetylase OafA/YrhL
MKTHEKARVTRLKPEIQGLRALAIAGVVMVHCWPGLLPGGQVGVDVFFVISGFLITGMLLREAETDGSISLPRFYARRARRLLPSAILVLGTAVVLVVAFVPRSLKDDCAREILASVLYVQNWFLAVGVDPDAADSPLTHFWSLSVEEQFYLAWPLLVIIGLVVARRFGMPLRPLLAVLLGSLMLLSFAYNVWQTGDDVRLAYFSTLGRAWEFGVGGLLALVPLALLRIPLAVRGAMSWAGLVTIVVTMIVASDHHVFPGWTVLLPVAGTLAIIAARDRQPAWGTGWIAGAAPVQWLASISYALYLWHWAIIAFAPFVTGRPSEWWFMVLLLALSVLLAWGTTRLLEDRVRGFRSRRAGSERVVLAGQR